MNGFNDIFFLVSMLFDAIIIGVLLYGLATLRNSFRTRFHKLEEIKTKVESKEEARLYIYDTFGRPLPKGSLANLKQMHVAYLEPNKRQKMHIKLVLSVRDTSIAVEKYINDLGLFENEYVLARAVKPFKNAFEHSKVIYFNSNLLGPRIRSEFNTCGDLEVFLKYEGAE